MSAVQIRAGDESSSHAVFTEGLLLAGFLEGAAVNLEVGFDVALGTRRHSYL
jgi:hypothetical protein